MSAHDDLILVLTANVIPLVDATAEGTSSHPIDTWLTPFGPQPLPRGISRAELAELEQGLLRLADWPKPEALAEGSPVTESKVDH